MLCIFMGFMGILSAFVAAPPVHAGFSVSPQIVTLEPSGRRSQQWVTVRHANDDDLPVAVELSILKREMDETGRIHHATEESDDGFVLYPAQMILYPGETQVVFIQWIKGAAVDKELVFSLVAQSVPIDPGAQKGGEEERGGVRLELRTIVRYEGLIFVRPQKARPDVVVESASVLVDGTPTTMLDLVLLNRGSARQKLKGMTLTVASVGTDGSPGGSAVTYRPRLPEDLTKHSLYAGYRRRFVLPWPEGVPVGPVKVTAAFE